MAIILVALVRVALGFLTAVLFSTGCCLCTTLPTKRVDFTTRFLIAWSLPTLLEHCQNSAAIGTYERTHLAHGVFRLRRWCSICGIGASSPTVLVRLPVLDKFWAGVALLEPGSGPTLERVVHTYIAMSGRRHG